MIMEDNGCCSTSVNVLMCPMDPATNDAGASTVGQYLLKLAAVMWRDGECADGKRPFGNSGWEWEIFTSLAEAGLIESTRDRYGDMDITDRPAAEALVTQALEHWIQKSAPPARQT